MRRLWLLIFSSILLLSLAACGGSGSQAPGSLQAIILGLPSGSDASISLSGPGGFSQTLKASQTLDKLVPGNYTVSGQNVTVGTTSYTPSLSAATVAVAGGQTATLDVTYAPPAGSTSSSTLSNATGGTLTLGPATLSIPANAFVTSGNVTVTLRSLGKPSNSDPGDPLQYVSDAYEVSAAAGNTPPNGPSNVQLNPQAPLSLSIVPNGDATNSAQDLIVGQRVPQISNISTLYRPDNADAGPKFGPVKYEKVGLDKASWIIRVPILSQQPSEQGILQVPWYYQSGIPWCAPTALTAMLRYYDFNETVPSPETLNASFGPSTALANWQTARAQSQGTNSGGGWPLDQLGLASKYTIYLWDAATFLPDSGAKGGFQDFEVYTVLVNTGLFGLIDRRPMVMGVDMWWHSVDVVGIAGDGLYLHDSNGNIAEKMTWDGFQQSATGWKKDAQGKQIFVQTFYTGVLNTGSGVAVKDQSRRRGSLVLGRGDLSFNDAGGNNATLEWDGADPHSYGYYFTYSSSSLTTPNTTLGVAAGRSQTLNYQFRVANVTNISLTYNAEVALANSDGSVIAGTPSTTAITVSPYTIGNYNPSSFTLPSSGGSYLIRFRLFQQGVLQDVKFIRFNVAQPIIIR
ncbi:MAG: hypothetical protein IVW51_16305 [Thermaceae bacterium]|nr:hypothetical protein [Thermaceae bacterium]